VRYRALAALDGDEALPSGGVQGLPGAGFMPPVVSSTRGVAEGSGTSTSATWNFLQQHMLQLDPDTAPHWASPGAGTGTGTGAADETVEDVLREYGDVIDGAVAQLTLKPGRTLREHEEGVGLDEADARDVLSPLCLEELLLARRAFLYRELTVLLLYALLTAGISGGAGELRTHSADVRSLQRTIE
jgi:hypothetical protein